MGAINIRDVAQWASLLRAEPRRPVLVHLNGDTTWLLQLPYPAAAAAQEPHRTHFNLLVDPWLQGPQSDVASWFSTQYHVVAPAVPELGALQDALRELEPAGAGDGNGSRIDAVAISHEFTDHCHKATLKQLPRSTPIYAADVAADLIRRWGFFDADAVVTAPGLAEGTPWTSLAHAGLPPWLRVGRLVTPGNSLYYHSALVIAFDAAPGEAEAVIYSPHGISAQDVAAVLPSCGLATTLAMLHGLHDVRLFPVKQLNLGALNAVEAVRAAGARYWIGTHDEEKTGKGLIAPLLRRTRYTLRQAVAHDEKQRTSAAGDKAYEFKELASGEALLLK
ncbi:uncharacterized protein LMH87_008905 [Akanthomyces muscarius]|uniref:Uncharacterized protein n=1 Tax=Akanthomyces muscarius TaxID=2231603 RepID=A0A9W8UQ46_AKAMU|nr:uncharacterized protein LMH87_008905 [Akanthomyces muscarius]KAJ4158376.1 hypothetical protein LMH87_008905 [Akanthomyces muscarius]